MRITANGPTGHGSRFIQNTAVEKLANILNRIYKYRKEQEDKCKCNRLGDVLTVNVTGLKAGVDAHNVIPSKAELVMDV